MDVREKLVELLEPHMSGLACEYESGSCELTSCRSCNAKNIADHLIANGVTVQEHGWIKIYAGSVYPYSCSKCGNCHARIVNFCESCGTKLDLPQPPKGE